MNIMKTSAESIWKFESAFPAYFAARLASLLASAMAPVVVAFGVLATDAGTHGLAVVMTARTVSLIALLPIAGILADRVSPVVLLTTGHSIAALSQVTAGFALATDHAPLSVLVGLEIVNGGANAIVLPVFSAVLPTIVASSQLVRANSAVAVSRSLATVAGPTLGSVLIALWQVPWGFWGNALLFALGAGAALALKKVHARRRADASATFFHDARTGWSEFVRRPWVWTVVLAFTFINAAFSGVQSVIGPAVAIARPGVRELGWGFLVSGIGVGMLVAGLLLYRCRLRRLLLVGLCGAAATAAMPLGLALGLDTLGTLPFFVVAGIGIELFSICWLTAMQQNIPVEQLGRVSTFDAIGSYAAIPAGTTAAGLFATAESELVLLVAGGVIILAAASPFVSRDVRKLPEATQAHRGR